MRPVNIAYGLDEGKFADCNGRHFPPCYEPTCGAYQLPMGVTMTTATIQCPCGTEVDVPLNLALEENEDGRQCITMDPDLSDLWAHSFTHDNDTSEGKIMSEEITAPGTVEHQMEVDRKALDSAFANGGLLDAGITISYIMRTHDDAPPKGIKRRHVVKFRDCILDANGQCRRGDSEHAQLDSHKRHSR